MSTTTEITWTANGETRPLKGVASNATLFTLSDGLRFPDIDTMNEYRLAQHNADVIALVDELQSKVTQAMSHMIEVERERVSRADSMNGDPR